MTSLNPATAAPAIGLTPTIDISRWASMNFGAGLLSRAWKAIRARQMAHSGPRRLRLTETVSLGEKRFVAVIQVDGLQFLVGGGATNVALLAQLNAVPRQDNSFSTVLKHSGWLEPDKPCPDQDAKEQA